MRRLHIISLAVLAVGFLAFAGKAFAEDAAKPAFTLSGFAAASFGQVNFDKTAEAPAGGTAPANTKAFTEFATSFEAYLAFTHHTDQWLSVAVLRVRTISEGSGGSLSGSYPAAGANGNSFNSPTLAGPLNDMYVEQWWTPGAFKLGIGKFQGQDWSQPFSGAYAQLLNPAGGDNVYWLNWTGRTGLDAEYNVGVVQIGVALSDQCVPSCNITTINDTSVGGLAIGSGAGNPRSSVNTMTVVPHLTGKFGDIGVRVQLPQTSGTIQNSSSTSSNNSTGTPTTTVGPLCDASTGVCKADSTKAASGSGYQIGVDWASGGIDIGLDVSGFTDAKIAELGQTKDSIKSGVGVRAGVPAGPGSLTVAYFDWTDNKRSSKTFDTTELTLRYGIPVTFGIIAPEFRTVTNGGAIPSATGGTRKDATNSSIRVIFVSNF
jgi:hypothetical protein